MLFRFNPDSEPPTDRYEREELEEQCREEEGLGDDYEGEDDDDWEDDPDDD